jgi:protein-L-isoaspartate(D-aspartate) O-methyltransferase
MLPFEAMRRAMIEQQLAVRGIRDLAVLDAMAEVPREEFVPPALASQAYEDRPLPIGEGQTISQPYIVALMTESALLRPTDRVLEVGTGSGYQAAVLSRIVSEVYTIERFPLLMEEAQRHLMALEFTNVMSMVGDGTKGWPDYAPYDAILVTAASPTPPDSLIEQLAPGGRLIIPVGDQMMQTLLRITKTPTGELAQEPLEAVRFVPLVGDEGW